MQLIVWMINDAGLFGSLYKQFLQQANTAIEKNAQENNIENAGKCFWCFLESHKVADSRPNSTAAASHFCGDTTQRRHDCCQLDTGKDAWQSIL